MTLSDVSRGRGIDIVLETYQGISINNSERSVRGEECGHNLHGITQIRTYIETVDEVSE